MKIDFSVIMANYNNAHYIAQAIESVINQTHQQWELIIIDDASSDDSVEVINTFLVDPRITLIKHDKNQGYTAALKTGIDNSRADIFGMLDSDDVLDINAVELMLDAHKDNNAGLIYSQFMYCDAFLNPQKVGYCRSIMPGETNLDSDVISHFKTFKKEVYQMTEGYDETIFGAEDKDISYKMEEAAPVYFVDKILYFYRVHDVSQSHMEGKKQVGFCNVEKAKANALKRRALLSRSEQIKQPYSEPLVSVVMPFRNVQEYIVDAVNSICVQTYDNWELIAVDDASTDKSPGIIKRFNDPRIKILQHDMQQGVANSLNDALKYAKGKYIGRMDGDDICEPDRLHKQITFLQNNPDIDFVGTYYYTFDNENGKKASGEKYPVVPHILKYVSLFSYCVLHATIVGKKEAFDSLEGYIDTPAEDVDFLSRAFRAGYIFANLSEELFGYRQHSEAVTARDNVNKRDALNKHYKHLQSYLPHLQVDGIKEIYHFRHAATWDHYMWMQEQYAMLFYELYSGDEQELNFFSEYLWQRLTYNPWFYLMSWLTICRPEKYSIYGTGAFTEKLVAQIIENNLDLPICVFGDATKRKEILGVPVKDINDVNESYAVLLGTSEYGDLMRSVLGKVPVKHFIIDWKAPALCRDILESISVTIKGKK